MPSNRLRIVIPAVAIVLTAMLAGCGGGDTQLSDAALRSSVPDDVEIDPDQPPEQLADKEIPTTCANDLGTGDPALEAAFCDYSEAARAATSGPDGVAGIDPALLSAGTDALALFASDPAAAVALLESATDALMR